MAQDDENIAETEWRKGFRERLRAIQGNRTQEVMAELLGISRDRYSKYVGSRGTEVPLRLLPRLAKIGDVTLEWLLEGPKGAEKNQTEDDEKTTRRKRRA